MGRVEVTDEDNVEVDLDLRSEADQGVGAAGEQVFRVLAAALLGADRG